MNIIPFSKIPTRTAIVAFIKDTARSRYTEKLFKWQYSDVKSNLYLLENNNKIYGSQGMLFYPLVRGGVILSSHKSETTYLDHSLRGQGWFEKLYEASLNEAVNGGSQMIWGFTALGDVWKKKLHFNCHKKLITESQLIIAPQKFRVSLIFFFSLIKTLQLRLKLLIIRSKNIVIDEVSYDELTSKISEWSINSNQRNVALDYSSSQIKNRILGSPIRNYHFIGVKENDEIQAVICYSIEQNLLSISEISIRPGYSEKAILKSLIRYALKQKEVKRIAFWGNYEYLEYQKIFNIFRNLSAKPVVVDSMQFVYRIVGQGNLNNNLAHYRINGFWTEGFHY